MSWPIRTPLATVQRHFDYIIGAGILALNGADTYSSGTIITGGSVAITNDNGVGAAPVSPGRYFVLNGGTLEAAGTFPLNANRGMLLGPYRKRARQRHDWGFRGPGTDFRGPYFGQLGWCQVHSSENDSGTFAVERQLQRL